MAIEISSCILRFDHSGPETIMLQNIWIDTMVVEALDHYVSRTSAAMVLLV